MLNRLLFLCTLILFFGCQKKGCEIPEEIRNMPVDVQIERLEKPFFSIQTKGDVVQFLNDHPTFSSQFLRRDAYPSDSILVRSLFTLAKDTSVHTLVKETNHRFENIDDLERDLELALKHVRFYFPNFQVPQVKTYISGLGQDLFVNDSIMVLGLVVDYFFTQNYAFSTGLNYTSKGSGVSYTSPPNTRVVWPNCHSAPAPNIADTSKILKRLVARCPASDILFPFTLAAMLVLRDGPR